MASRLRQFTRSSLLRWFPLAIGLTISAIGATIASAATGAGKIAPPLIQHVFIVIEENRGYSQVLGSPEWPYFNSLVAEGGLAGNYFATGHPSIDNYFMLTTGKPITFNDNYSKEVKVYNLARELLAMNADWKVYAEDLPSPNPTVQTQDPYEKHHNPFAYFTDIVDQPDTWSHLVDFSQLAADEQADTLPQFGFIIPNAYHSGHSADPNSALGEDQEADAWLQQKVPALLQTPGFQQSGLLIITWDEGNGSDHRHGGGRIATLLLGPKVKPGFISTTYYRHPSALRLIVQAMGMPKAPGASAHAPMMGEFFSAVP
jgi:acid phosphatase